MVQRPTWASLTCATAALCLLVAGLPLQAEQASILAVGSAEQLGPREVRLSVTFHNLGGKLPLDYTAFIHFDRLPDAEALYVQEAPGLRPLVAGTTSSAWGPDETVTVTFAPVTVPAGLHREVYVRVGMYDPKGDGGRLPLVGANASGRVPVGKLVPEGDKYVFLRTPLAAGGTASERLGVRPRGLVKAPPGQTLVRFGEEDLAKWRVDGLSGGTAHLERTREQLCWSESSLRVAYSGESGASSFVLRPSRECPLQSEATAAYLWVFGNAIGWAEVASSEAPLLGVFLELRDGKGAVHSLPFPSPVNYPYWFVHRVRLPADWPRPLTCTGIGFTGCSNRQSHWLMLDTLSCAREAFPATLATTVRLDDLPFPLTPDGPLPQQLAGECRNAVEAFAGGYRLSYTGADGRLAYELRPSDGTLGDVEAQWFAPGATAPAQRLRLAAVRGPTLEIKGRKLGPAALAGTRKCLEARIVGGRVLTKWRWDTPGGPVSYELAFGVKGKSLLVDVTSEGEALTGFTAGQLTGQGGARFVPVPYWSYGLRDWGRDGGVVVVGKLFLSGLLDLYRSAATAPTFDVPVSHEPEALLPGGIAYCPGVEYQLRSDGKRNPLRERFIFTLSPEVREVLPTIAHPPSPNAAKLAAYAHSTGGQASRLEEQLGRWRRLHAYGVDKVYIRHFDGMWADESQGTQEWTLTEHVAPVAGDVAVRKYLDALSAMGFLPVLYTNYTDLQPVAAEFDWDRVIRLPGGEISPFCWPGSYPLKPLAGVALERQYAPRIKERFGTQGSFCDVHTSAAPWHKVDCDARLPGAAQFGTTYRAYAKLLMAERTTYGAVYSEGSRHWLYAGLHDGSDAQLCAPKPHLEPFLVDFDLLRIHPLEMDAGMSWLGRYVKDPFVGPKSGSPEQAAAQALGGWEAALDRFNAATLAFGHQATLTETNVRGYDSDIRTYCMIQPVQLLYAMRKAEAITYHDPATGRSMGPSEAIITGVLRDSQVFVRYDSGLEVRVNGSLTEPWRVEAAGTTWELPPSGWVCAAAGKVLSWSALVVGARADYCSTPDMRFADARGAMRRVGEFETDGAVLARKSGAGWTVFPLGAMKGLKVDLAALGVKGPVTAVVRDEEGRETRRQQLRSDGLVELPVASDAFRIELTP